MKDLVERLREDFNPETHSISHALAALMTQAADEIEWLRAEANETRRLVVKLDAVTGTASRRVCNSTK